MTLVRTSVSWRRFIRRVARGAVDVLFPRLCVACGRVCDSDASSLCQTCDDELEHARQRNACPRCACDVSSFEVSDGRCRRCRTRPWPIVGTVRAGHYAGKLGALIRAYKYHGRESLEGVLGGWLASAVADAPWSDRIEAVVSVPTHWKHRLDRPYHAAEVLATVAAARLNLAHVPILRRVRAGPHQIGLNYTARAENVRGAFALRRGVALHASRLLLIDDVKTTGATITECTKMLRSGGAGEVYAAVVVTAGDSRTA